MTDGRNIILNGLVALLVLAPAASRAITVTSISPRAQVIDADYSTNITVTFTAPVDPLTVNSSTIRVFGRWSGPMSGTYRMENGNLRARFVPDTPFSAGEWVTVSVCKAITNSDGAPLAAPYTWNFWIRTAASEIDALTYYTRVSIRNPGDQSWVQAYGAYAGDLNNDGYSDLAVPCELSNDLRVFLNNGAGMYTTFTILPLPGGAVPSANEGADFNMDGEIDMVVANGGNNQLSIILGDGTGGFPVGTHHTAAQTIKGVGVIDLDGDGFDDIVSANRFGDNMTLLRNNGDGTFPAAGANQDTGGSQEFSCAVADANNDGLQDVFIGCYVSREVRLFLGDGNGGVSLSSAVGIDGQPWMLAVGDLNNDGNVDVVAANSYASNAGVALGDGSGGFLSSTTYPVGTLPLAIDLGDLDGDGDLDLVTSNYESADWTILENEDGVFTNRRNYTIDGITQAGSCAILHDRDNDLDLDFTGIDELDDAIYIFENQAPPIGPATRSVLLQNQPNPFNPTTRIEYIVPAPMHARLTVHDARGRLVATLVNEVVDEGLNAVEWDGTNVNGMRVSSGVYFYRLDAANASLVRKMVLVK